jgi:hypothetical protein
LTADSSCPLAGLAAATSACARRAVPELVLPGAWWSYVFVVDALVRRLGVPSLIRGRGREFLGLCGVSIVLWTLFEALNLRLGTWYYVMDHPSRAARWVGGASPS